MTKEKAIECLTLLKVFDAPVLAEAVKMAVIALRTQADTPPNDPLTLEELREMDGEPVWIEWGGHPQAGWALVRVWSKASNVVYLTYHNGNTDLLGFVLNDGGKIYRRRPEEGTL